MSRLFEEVTIEIEEILEYYTVEDDQGSGILRNIDTWSRDDLIKIKSLIDLALQEQRRRNDND